MEVRPLLLVSLVVVAGVGISAVLFPAIAGHGEPPEVTTTDRPAVDSSVPSPYRGDQAPPNTAIQVGAGGRVYHTQVWNDSPTNRTVSLALVHEASNSSLVDRTETLRPNGTVRIELRAPADYLLEVVAESTGRTDTHRVTEDKFDCNDHFATVRVDGNGSVDSSVISTAMGC